MFQNKKLSIGIIGAGAVVEGFHLPVLGQVPDVSVSWVTDSDYRRAQAVGHAFGVSAIDIAGNPARLPEADVVLLAIPYRARFPYYPVLADRGSALYVEKPLALGVEEHRALCSRFPEHRLGCGLQRRSWGPVRVGRDTVRAQTFGRLRAIHLGWGSMGRVRGAGFLADVKAAGGGVLAEHAVHAIDSALFCASAASADLRAAHVVMSDGLDIHAEAAITLRTDDGSCIDFEIAATCLRDTINGIEFQFQHATMFLPAGAPEVRVRTAGGAEFTLAPRRLAGYPRTPSQTLYTHWRNFIEGVRSARANYTSAASTIITTSVLEQLYAAQHPAVPDGGMRCSASE